MEIFFNEISVSPQAATRSEARSRIMKLLETMRSIQEFDFRKIRTHDGFYAEELADHYSFSTFLSDSSVRRDMKILLGSITVNPYIEDEDFSEMEEFVNHSFTTLDEKGDEVNPEGIASAYIYDAPVISIDSDPHWRQDSLELFVTSDSEASISIAERVLNVYSPDCREKSEFIRWKESMILEVQLNSEENIYKVFSSDRYLFEKKAVDDIIFWHNADIRYILRIKKLIKDIWDNPFMGGLGKTEVLKEAEGRATKRIAKKDRIVYTYTSEKIIIHQCRGHYEDT